MVPFFFFSFKWVSFSSCLAIKFQQNCIIFFFLGGGGEGYFNLNRETEIVKNGRIVKDNTGSPFHLHVQLCSRYELLALGEEDRTSSVSSRPLLDLLLDSQLLLIAMRFTILLNQLEIYIYIHCKMYTVSVI